MAGGTKRTIYLWVVDNVVNQDQWLLCQVQRFLAFKTYFPSCTPPTGISRLSKSIPDVFALSTQQWKTSEKPISPDTSAIKHKYVSVAGQKVNLARWYITLFSPSAEVIDKITFLYYENVSSCVTWLWNGFLMTINQYITALSLHTLNTNYILMNTELLFN